MTHALSAILVSRMVFNLREAGTEVHEGTMEWHSRVERETATMQLQQFRIPKTTGIRNSLTDSLNDLSTTGGAEVGGFGNIAA